MKNNMKRMLAFFLSVNCFFTMPLPAGAEDEVAETIQIQTASQTTEAERQIPRAIEMEAGFLTALGMIPEDVDFDSYVTREETAVLLCRMLAREDLAESYSNVSYYEDVSVYSENVGYINVVTNEGLFRGRSETIFDPASPITYGELAKLLVTATGYSIQAERMGGYPDGYLRVASQLKIINNISYGGSVPVKWGDAVKMVYEAMYVDVLQSTIFTSGNVASIEKIEGQNILTIHHKLFWDKGQITGTPRSKLYGMGPSDELDIGEIEIDGSLYTYDTEKLTYLDDLTGYLVEYFYRENSLGGYEVVYVSLKNNDTITVMSYDIQEVYGFDMGDNGNAYLKYLDEDTMKKSEKLSLDKGLSLIVNDNTVPNVTNAQLFPECGTITLIDSNYDNTYDVAKVLSYNEQIVDTVSIYDKHIFFKETLENPTGSVVPLVLNPVYKDVYYDITCDGEVISLSKLREGDVVGIIESEKDDFVYYRIELLSSSVEGTVEAYSDTEIDIDGKTYKVAPSFDFSGIELGETYTLYFDFADRLFHAEIAEEAISFEYVLIAAGLEGGGLSKKAQVKICHSPDVRSKTVDIYDLAENVKINGKRCKPSEAVEKLKLSEADASQVQSDYLQPLRYLEFNDAGEVSMIETVDDVTSGSKISGNKTTRTYIGTGPYNEAFRDKAGIISPITYETHMFYVPETMLDDDWNYAEYGHIKFGTSYTTILWGETADSAGAYPECVFLYHNRTSTDPSFNIDYELPMLVSDIKMVYNSSEDEYLPKIETYNSGARFTFSADPRNSNRACFDNIKPGDIIFPALTSTTSSNTPTKVQSVPSGKMWSCDKLLSLSDETLYYYNQINQFYGRVETIRTDPRRSKCVVGAFVGEAENRSVSLTGVPIYYYDRGENTVNLATYAAIKPAEVYGMQDASRIFVFFDESNLDEQGQFKAMMAVIVGEK